MHIKLAAATLAASITLGALAAPETTRSHQVTLKQTPHGKVYRSVALALVQMYEKYGKTPPADVVKAAARATKKKQSTSVSADPEAFDKEYLVPVYIGGSRNLIYLDFDTGSSDLWTFSSQQPASQTAGHTVYNLTGTLARGESWNITYADGSGAHGNVYADSVKVGSITATGQAVEAAVSASPGFTQDTPKDGVLGLAYQGDNKCVPSTCKTFFNTIVSSLVNPIFSFALARNAPGTFTFGYVDTSLYTGPLKYMSLQTSGNGQYYYTAKAGNYAISSASNVQGTVGTAIFDTGTTLLALPPAIVTKYYSNVPNSAYDSGYGAYLYPCSETLPAFYIQLGTTYYEVPSPNLVYGPVNSTTCYGGIQSSGTTGFTILGDIFLTSVYVVIQPNSNPPQIGLAKQK